MITAIPALSVCTSHPRNPDSGSTWHFRKPWTQNLPNDLMPWNQPRTQRRQFTFDNVKVGPANSAGKNAQKNLPRARLRPRNFLDPQRPLRNLPGRTEYGCFHEEPPDSGRDKPVYIGRGGRAAQENWPGGARLNRVPRCYPRDRTTLKFYFAAFKTFHARSREPEPRRPRTQTG